MPKKKRNFLVKDFQKKNNLRDIKNNGLLDNWRAQEFFLLGRGVLKNFVDQFLA